MNKKTMTGLLTASTLLVSTNLFAQFPILRSTATTAPAITGIAGSHMTQLGNFVGIGTIAPSQRLTLAGSIERTLPGNPSVETPPAIRFEFTGGMAPQYWHLVGSGVFSLVNAVNSTAPMRVSQSGEVDFMDKVNLNVQGITGTNDNRLGFFVDNTRRRILWTAYTSTGGNSSTMPLEFVFDAQGVGSTDVTALTMLPNGRVGIGTTAPSERLHISGGNVLISNGTFTVGNGTNQFKVYTDGKVRAREVLVDLQTIPDYVFASNYPLMPISELKTYIQQHKHLPGIPSESEYQERGSINLGELDLKLLEKVEELTQYIILLEERLNKLEQQPTNSGNVTDTRPGQ